MICKFIGTSFSSHLPHSVQYDKFGSYRCPPSNAPIAPRVPAPCHPWQTQPSKIFQIRTALPAERRDLSRRPAAEQRLSGQKDTKKNKKTHKSRRSTYKRFLQWNCFTVCTVGTIYHPLFSLVSCSISLCVPWRDSFEKGFNTCEEVRSLDTLTANLGPPLSSEAQSELSKISNIWTKVPSHSSLCPVDPTRWTDDVKFSKLFCRESY